MTMHHLYDTLSEKIIRTGVDPYTVDGQPGSLPDHIIEITDAEDPRPEAPSGQVATASTAVDTVARVLRTTWTLVDAPLVPVRKLAIKRRVTPEEWEAIKAVIASDPVASEEWELATEIDPNHPQTAAMIAYLQGQGLLTTTLKTIFATE